MKWYRLILACVLLVPLTGAAGAQTDLFATALTVNGQAISNFEIQQRVRMARLLDVPGRTRAEAIEELIDERLYFQEADRLGIRLPASILNQRIEQYAEGRAGSAANLYAQLRNAGISREVFREYARANIIWQDVQATRFGAWASLLTADDLNQQAEFNPGQAIALVNLSELVISTGAGERDRGLALAREIRSNIQSLAGFREAVEVFSLSPSRSSGGSIGWLQVSGLPPGVQSAIRGTASGAVTGPVVVDDNVMMFYVHDRETRTEGNVLRGTSYATVQLGATGEDTASRVVAGIASCKDLERQSAATDGAIYAFHEKVATIPRALVATLNGLDTGESAVLAQDSGALIVMLCQRHYLPDDNQDQLIGSYRQEWLDQSGNAYLSRLRADAIINRY